MVLGRGAERAVVAVARGLGQAGEGAVDVGERCGRRGLRRRGLRSRRRAGRGPDRHRAALVARVHGRVDRLLAVGIGHRVVLDLLLAGHGLDPIALAVAEIAGGVEELVLVGAVHDVELGILGLGALVQEGLVAEAVEVVGHQVAAADRQAVELVAAADVAVRAADGDVEEALVLAESLAQDAGRLEQVAALVLGGDLERRHHRRRQAPVVVARLAGADRIEQAHRLRHLPRRHQRRLAEFHPGDVAVLVLAVPGAARVLDAAFVDQPRERGLLLGAAAEADPGDVDLRLGILVQPLLGLLGELPVHLLDPRLEGGAAHLVARALQPAVLGARPFHVAVADIAVHAGFELLHDPGHVGVVLRVVLVHAVAGAVEGGDEQARMRVGRVEQYRRAQLRQLRAGLHVTVQVVRIGGIGLYAVRILFAAHRTLSLALRLSGTAGVPRPGAVAARGVLSRSG